MIRRNDCQIDFNLLPKIELFIPFILLSALSLKYILRISGLKLIEKMSLARVLLPRFSLLLFLENILENTHLANSKDSKLATPNLVRPEKAFLCENKKMFELN